MSEETTPESTEETAAQERPLLRVVNPDATAEEVAALVAVFSALGSGQAPAPKPKRVWGAPERLVRQPVAFGRGAWRGSAMPR
ncbi:MAG: acyl-CoA carboxylase subunit epsilon [Nocardioides sp.]|nr:acyl-CoA carboxylase subunit epsilon [Nocardioides sp.]